MELNDQIELSINILLEEVNIIWDKIQIHDIFYWILSTSDKSYENISSGKLGDYEDAIIRFATYIKKKSDRRRI